MMTRARLKGIPQRQAVALDRDKAEFGYQLCRANNRARRIVEIGLLGVSTLYLARR